MEEIKKQVELGQQQLKKHLEVDEPNEENCVQFSAVFKEYDHKTKALKNKLQNIKGEDKKGEDLSTLSTFLQAEGKAPNNFEPAYIFCV